MEAIRGARIRLGVDPLGGAGVHYWGPIAARYGIDLTVVNTAVDPTFRFMTVDWDGQIRMDPSSASAMQSLIGLKDRFDIAFACDTDHDRHGIVTQKRGVAAAQSLPFGRHLLSPPQPAGLAHGGGSGENGGEQPDDRSGHREAGSEALRGTGRVQVVRGRPAGRLACLWRRGERGGVVRPPRWRSVDHGQGRNRPCPAFGGNHCRERAAIPGEIYHELTREFGEPAYDRVEAPATPAQKEILRNLSPQQVRATDLAGEKITAILTRAPGNGAPIGGLKAVTENGWFAARPSGTEDIYKIYAESFRGPDHLRRILEEAEAIVAEALGAALKRSEVAPAGKGKP